MNFALAPRSPVAQAGNCLAAQIGIVAARNALALTTGDLQSLPYLQDLHIYLCHRVSRLFCRPDRLLLR